MLTDHHRALLAERAVTGAVVTRRGYDSVTDWHELAAVGFPERQAKLAHRGMLIPRYGLDGRPSWPKFRPDPEFHNGGPKYTSPGGSWNLLDALPGTNLRGDLWLSAEGFIKSDAMTACGVDVVAIDGVWGWKSAGAPILGLETLARPGRWFHVVCDSDVESNPRVASAMFSLAGWLRHEGAKVRLLHPPGQLLRPGSKVGVDDHLAAGGTLDQLVPVVMPSCSVRRDWALRRFAVGVR